MLIIQRSSKKAIFPLSVGLHYNRLHYYSQSGVLFLEKTQISEGVMWHDVKQLLPLYKHESWTISMTGISH